MKKDYVRADSPDHEAAFVAAFWDGVWRDTTESQARRGALRKSEEYAFLSEVFAGRKGLDILDCGCGTGDWTLLLREDGHSARGIDIAPLAVARLREQFADVFSLGDFRAAPFADASFDVVLNWGGIEHFEDGPLPSIREAHRLLRPGGAFVATTPLHNLRLALRDRLAGPQQDGAGPDRRFYQYRFTRAELEGFFRDAGFDGVRSRPINAAQGIERAFQHELRPLARVLPRRARSLLGWAAAPLLRPLLAHMVICAGVRR